MAEVLTSYAPAVEVGPVPASPRRYGLLSVAINVTEDRAAAGGFEWVNDCGTVGVTTDDCLYEPDSGTLFPSPIVCSDLPRAWPFVVYTIGDGPVVGESAAEARDRVTRRLTLGEEIAVEKEVWAGAGRAFTVPDGLVLSNPSAATIVGASMADALGRVESALAAAYGGQGVIHMSPYAATILGTNVLTIEGGRMFTIAGSRVVVGGGYERVSADVETIVGTGPVRVARSPIVVTDDNVFDRATNTRAIVAQRAYAVGWDCAHVAASYDVTP